MVESLLTGRFCGHQCSTASVIRCEDYIPKQLYCDSSVTAHGFNAAVHITGDHTWPIHTDAVLKKAHQWLFFLRQLRTFSVSTKTRSILHMHCGEDPDWLHHCL
ncbi:unnamed protein product [Leuciscus chuanchicus]